MTHARGAVNFMSGVQTALLQLQCNVVLEIGPQPHLSPHVERIADELRKQNQKADCQVIRTLR